MAEERRKALLVIVSGVPVAGKTTLAKRLAPELGLVRLSKDALRETMGDWLPPKSHQEARALGGAAYALCFQLAEELLERGVDVLLEAAFQRGSAERWLTPLVAQSQAALIHLTAPLQLTDQRFRERFAKGKQHQAHMDELTVGHQGVLFADVWPRWERPLALDVPTLEIDTSGGYVTDLSEILAFLQAHTQRQ